jgi:hypothetical protein
LHERIKKYAHSCYDNEIKRLKEEAYKRGYSAAYRNEEIEYPSEVSNNPILKKEFHKGFFENDNIVHFKKTAYQLGLDGKDLVIPIEVAANNGEAFIKKYYDSGKKEFLKKEKKIKLEEEKKKRIKVIFCVFIILFLLSPIGLVVFLNWIYTPRYEDKKSWKNFFVNK